MKKTRGSRYQRGYRRASLIFCVIYFICIFLPLALLLVWSVTDAWPWPNLLPERLSLRAFSQVYHSGSSFPSALLLTIIIGISVSALTVFSATLAARALVRYVFRGREAFRFGTILPFLVPQTVFAMGIQVLFFKIGLANTVLGVIVAHSVVALPYAVSIMVDVTQAAGSHLEEQGRVLGASGLKALRLITLPSLLPGILSAASMSYIISIGNYFVTLLIGGGNVSTVMTVMFPFLTVEDRAIAGVYAVSFLAVTLLVFIAFEMILSRLGVKEQKNLFGG
jgi:putative spermidine/putrescine transport system permease protein